MAVHVFVNLNISEHFLSLFLFNQTVHKKSSLQVVKINMHLLKNWPWWTYKFLSGHTLRSRIYVSLSTLEGEMPYLLTFTVSDLFNQELKHVLF